MQLPKIHLIFPIPISNSVEKNTIAHETLHVLSLSHTNDSNSLMYKDAINNGSNEYISPAEDVQARSYLMYQLTTGAIGTGSPQTGIGRNNCAY